MCLYGRRVVVSDLFLQVGRKVVSEVVLVVLVLQELGFGNHQ